MSNNFPFQMPAAAILDWINSNAPAITALATIFLVLITAIYVVVTYLLVREQRAQKQTPNVEYEFDPELADVAQVGGAPRADLKIQNVGDGTATAVAFLEGPGEGIPVEMPALGERMTLLPGEFRIVKIRPPAGQGQFPAGELPLLLSFSESGGLGRIVFKVLLLEFSQQAGRWGIRNVGSSFGIYSTSGLKRLTCRKLGPREKASFLWEFRSTFVITLLLDERVREALRADLERLLERLRSSDEPMKALRNRL